MEENEIVMDTIARNVKVSLGGGNFIIKNLSQCEGQTADLLIGNDFLLQQTVIQKPQMIGIEKNRKFCWESRLIDAVRVTSKGFIDQYQKLPAKSGNYKSVLQPVLLLQDQLTDLDEILVNEATSSEDSKSEKNYEYQISDSESPDGEEEYIKEHNLKVKMHLDSIALTAFGTPQGHYECQSSDKIKPKADFGWDENINRSKPTMEEEQSDTSNEEKLVNKFLLCPKGTTSTDRSQGKRLASPSQTADDNGISSPFMAAALPKSRRVPFRANKLPLVTGKKVVHDQPLKIFQKPVFKTERLLAFK
ncbi:hypothetical protein ACLB2K_016031 [Fragaria x ananassa]